MKYLRRWDLPTFEEPIVEHIDQIEGWGVSYFWYCCQCRAIYASVMVSPEDCSHRIWQGISGLCMICEPDKWKIRGDISCIHLVGWKVPIEVAMYQLEREIDYLSHPSHPHNHQEIL